MVNKTSIDSVFIAQAINVGWIIEKLMKDVAQCLEKRGVRVRIGNVNEYKGENVVFHSRYLYAKPIDSAILNSVFVTHIDDSLKEIEIKREFKRFDSFVCLSPSDADFLKGLGCPPKAAFGINLPHRGMSIRPIKFAVFSERYEDGRKNEDWILSYLRQLPQELKNGMVLCLFGYNWESFCIELASIGASYELYRYDRNLPGEYDFQKEILASTNYLLYPGFDGGAMCVYDAISSGVSLIVSEISYHKNLMSNAKTFRTKDEFYKIMDETLLGYSERIKIVEDRSIDGYVNNLMEHWQTIISMNIERNNDVKTVVDSESMITNKNQVSFYRSYYKKPTLRRISSALFRIIRKFIKS